MRKILIAGALFLSASWAQSQIKSDSIPTQRTLLLRSVDTLVFEEVIIDGTRAGRNTPFKATELKAKDLEPLNTGVDLPYLLRFTPSLVATSDAGNGVGYTGLWIRGSDPSRINVTINGIPLNDPESQQVFWVNTPDFGTSLSSVQIQRGVGTSANGAASFGGSIKLETTGISLKPTFRTTNGFGSFNTQRNNIIVGSGLINNRFAFETRLSRIASDGYIDRAKSNLKSFFTEGAYYGNKTTIRANLFGGRETTYQSWYGTPWEVLYGTDTQRADFAVRNGMTAEETQNLLQSGRTYNYYTYDNQVDNYGQDHAQLHIQHRVDTRWTAQLSGHYTHGEGYFEEYKNDEAYSDYGLEEPMLDSLALFAGTDVIRRRWLKNDFFGITGFVTYTAPKLELVVGGAKNEYKGRHFGELIWLENNNGIALETPYYKGKSVKHDGNVYTKATWTPHSKWSIYGDIQLRRVSYVTDGIDNDLRAYDVDDKLLFFNPKLGVSYFRNPHMKVYASAAAGSKEPNRNDYVDAVDWRQVKPETMLDTEVGMDYRKDALSWSVNLYSMDYQNQLVLTGELNDVGAPLRTNVAKSYRRGIELEVGYAFLKRFTLQANATLSENKIEQFKEVLYDYTVDFDVVETEYNNTTISFSPSVIAGGQLTYQLPLFKGAFDGSIK